MPAARRVAGLMADPTLWLALASAACYALGLVLAQLGLRQQSPRGVAMISLPSSAILLWLIAAWLPWPDRLAWPAIAVFAAVGALFPIGVTLLSFEANRHLGPTLAGALGNVTPLVAVAFATLVLGEHLTMMRAAGMLVVVGGVVLLTLRGKLDRRDWPLWALLFPLGAALIRGTAQPAMKLGLLRWPNPFAATLVSYTVSALVILAVTLGGGRRRIPRLERRGIPLFVLVGLSNGASVLLLYMALSAGGV